MRRSLGLVALALAVFGLTLCTSLRGEVLINLTNQLWKYTEGFEDPGAFWLYDFDDSLWPEGHGIFAYEDSTSAALMTNVYPYTNTVLLQPSATGITVVYFRTHFTFSGDPNKFVLVSSNLIDDGYVMYLNGVEIDRYNMNPNDTLAALANGPGEGRYLVRPMLIPVGVLTNGDNLLAVRVHQNSANSTDVVWGSIVHASRAPASFQDGTGGYNETQDTEAHQGTPTANLGQSSTISVDLADPAPNQSQALLRFDHIIGGSPGQVPLDAVINSATLRLYTVDATDATTPVRMMRMLVPWDESSSWNSMVNGIDQTNGVETSVEQTLIDGSQVNSFDDIDVTAAVQAWANGVTNYGWAFLPTGTNGWDFASSENGTIPNRPRLLVDFLALPSPCMIVDDPDSVTVAEKRSFVLRVLSRGTDLMYQWYKDGAAIPGATADTYSVAWAVPTNSGTYRVVVQSEVSGVCTSAPAIVTVNADTVPPRLLSALGNPDQTTITLTFDDTIDPVSAGNPVNYTLTGGRSVTNAAVTGGTVTLTTDAPRAIGTQYTLTITGVHDDAAALNVIEPNPTVTNLAQQIRLVAFDAAWKFNTNGLDLGTSWKETSYNDSAWPSAAALLGFEPDAATQSQLAQQGLNTNNATLWQRTRPDGTTNITYYLRTAVNIPFVLSNATVTVRHVIDDGAVFYFNGEERFRFNMPTGAVGYLTEALIAPTEGTIRSATLTNIDCGNNLIAVSLHNDAPSSSDILFGAELLATFTSFQPCGGGGTLQIVKNANGTITLSWSPGGGVLQESSDLKIWTTSTNQSNPQTIMPTGAVRFYRVP